MKTAFSFKPNFDLALPKLFSFVKSYLCTSVFSPAWIALCKNIKKDHSDISVDFIFVLGYMAVVKRDIFLTKTPIKHDDLFISSISLLIQGW